MQRCTACAGWIFYPREQCPVCFSQKLEWAPVSGRGRVYTFTIVHQPAHPAFLAETPYTYAIVQLDEGVRVPTNIVECGATAWVEPNSIAREHCPGRATTG